MKRKKLNYGCVKGYADGGKVELYEKPKMKPHVPAKVVDPIASKVKSSPGGPHTPGEKAKRAKRNPR